MSLEETTKLLKRIVQHLADCIKMYAQQCSEIHITKFQLLPTGFLFIINPPRRKKREFLMKNAF